MEKTANYQLPQWVKEDAIKMEDFNAAFGTLDGALKTQSDAIAGKAGGEDLTAVRQEIAAAREANCLLKLAGPVVTTAANAAMNFDLSQVDMTKVAALFFTFSAGETGGSMTLSANGTELGTLCSHSWSTSAGMVWITPYADGIAFYTALVSSGSGTGGSGAKTSVKWDALNSLTISGTSYAGATATLFAVRK